MSRLSIPDHIDAWNAAGDGHLPGHMGMHFICVEPDRVEGRLAIAPHHLAWNGFLHAATVVALADTACGYGTVASLPDDAHGFTTVELKSNFLGTAREGSIEVVATPLHKGRTTQVWDAVVSRSGSDKAIAQFRCTQLLLRSTG